MSNSPFTILPGTVAAKPQVVTEAAVKTPPVTVKSPEQIVQDIQGRVKAAIAKRDGTAAPAVAKPADDPAKPADTDTEATEQKNVPPKFLAELGRLQARVRELEPKTKEYDSLKPDAELVRELKKLWSGSHEDKVTALAKLSGKDGLDELAAIVHAYYASEQAGDSDDKKDQSPEMKMILARLEKSEKELADLKAGKTKEDEDKTKNATAENEKRANEYVKGFIVKNKEKFELCSRPENEAEAIEAVQDAALAIIDREKIDIKAMDQTQAEKVYLEALQETETEFENTGKRFSKANARAAEPDLDRFTRFVRPHSKPAIVVKEEAELSNNPKERFEQILERNRRKAEAGLFRR